MMDILVTRGSGFIGRNIVKMLKEEGNNAGTNNLLAASAKNNVLKAILSYSSSMYGDFRRQKRSLNRVLYIQTSTQ